MTAGILPAVSIRFAYGPDLKSIFACEAVLVIVFTNCSFFDLRRSVSFKGCSLYLSIL